MTAVLRFNGAVRHSGAIDAWFDAQPPALGSLARQWFAAMRRCGAQVRELMHDGCPTACVDDAGFAYVNVYTAHVNVGFFQGTSLADPAGLLQGTGRFMRHVKLRPAQPVDGAALAALIDAAYGDMQRRVAMEPPRVAR